MSRPTAEPSPSFSTHLAMYLILITAVVRLGTAMYLPALPAMKSDLLLSAHQLSLTLTVYLLVFAGASIVLGPLSDHVGRTSLIRGGLIAFLAGSACCAWSNDAAALLVGRALQAVGGSAVQLSSRAMTRDALDDHAMMNVLGWIGVMSSLAPVLGPILGGLITQSMGWRSNFYLLLLLALLLLLSAWRNVPETLARDRRVQFNLPGTLNAYGVLLKSANFMVPMLPVTLCFALQGAYLAASPFIFMRVFGMSPAAFGSTSLALVTALIAGRFLCMFLLKRHAPFTAWITGCALCLAGGISFLGVAITDHMPVFTVLAASGLFCFGFGALMPVGMKSALSAFPERTGVASALFGCLTLAATGAGSALMGTLLRDSLGDVVVLAYLTGAVGGLTLLCGIFARRAVNTVTTVAPQAAS